MTTSERTRFEAWNAAIASSLIPENHDRVPELIGNAANILLPSNDFLVVVFGPTIAPRPLYDNIPEPMWHKTVHEYYAGAYLVDPFYRLGIETSSAGVYTLDEVSPEGFRESEYFKRYLKGVGVIDEVVVLTRLPDGLFSHFSFCNVEGQARFCRADVDRLTQAVPVIDQIFRNYWQREQHREAADTNRIHEHLEVALARFGESLLTKREAEVINLYLRGYNTQAVSKQLRLSKHTVAMHRKNAYLKLDVRSQFELFHLFIDSMSCFDPQAKTDPLTSYMSSGKAFADKRASS